MLPLATPCIVRKRLAWTSVSADKRTPGKLLLKETCRQCAGGFCRKSSRRCPASPGAGVLPYINY